MKKVLLAIAFILCVIATGNAQTIRSTSNSAIATIDEESDGTVRDSNNHTLGTAKGVPQRYAVLFFFFKIF